MAVDFIPIDRDTPYMLPPSVQDYVPTDHLARFVVEIVDQLDLGAMVGTYCCFPRYSAKPFPGKFVPDKTTFPGLFGISLGDNGRSGAPVRLPGFSRIAG